MDEKKCGACGHVKQISEFNRRGDNLQGRCRACNKARLRKHYLENKQYYRDKHNRHRAKVFALFRDWKKDKVCSICGEDHVACIVLHHRNPNEKQGGISYLISRGWGWNRILDEILKCDILCANCHRKLHYRAVGLEPPTAHPLFQSSALAE